MKIVLKIILKILGWKIGGITEIQHDKYLVVVAPHTSNWDFIYGILFAYQLPFKIQFLAKSQLFTFAYGWFFRVLGGIPVDRTKKNDLVSQVVDIIDQKDKIVVGIAPEGTRKRTEKWKTGFYYIAREANIPIALAFIDYKTKTIGIDSIFFTSDKKENDLKYIESIYSKYQAKYPMMFNNKIS